ncbi:VWA domain-containing protein [Bacillus sp. B15-48]|uniref:vWA domain-containing protein n=1 Tax=Bacillus sp. B15-48 TaxID=1548601 RepID=UPI00193EDC45|nr:VWA domain-containing protein [Bacillus sp. B15-48]MBM4763247.1 VWA domain-containing protein [Bacillus sp. B15-48]
MNKCLNILAFLVISLFFLAGCNQDNEVNRNENNPHPADNVNETNHQNNAEQKIEENKVLKLEPLPSTYEELASRKMGEYHDFYFSLNSEEIQGMLDIFSTLPDVSNNPTDEELDYFYQEILAMVQEDFEGPERAIRQLRFQSIGDPEIEDSRYQFKENLNVVIILDASGSMAATVNGQVKMNAAKAAILKFVNELPDEANVGLRVFGHKGTGAYEDRELSCQSSEMIIPISTFNETSFQSGLELIKPSGWTPTELAIREAKKDLEKFDGSDNTNIVYLVGDGISTCDDDPIKAAEELFHSNISPIINVIGFDVDNEGQNQLKEIANVTEGLYTHVSDGNELSKELSKVSDLAKTWEQWKTKGTQSLEYKKVNNTIDIFNYITQEESKAVDEKVRIDLIITQFWQNELMDRESFQYLQDKNNQYHDWVIDKIRRFNQELKELNEKNYTEALKILEEKYEQNTQ